MTRVDFYVLPAPAPASRLAFAARLTDKAFQQGHRVYLHTPDEGSARELDELLWSFRTTSFIPHALIDSDENAQVCIGWRDTPGRHDDLLINLDLNVPAFFSRFARVAEVVCQHQPVLDATRTSYKFYQDRGYQLDTHRLQR